MKINLTHKEANLLAAIIWELAEEPSIVVGSKVWRLSEAGSDVCRSVFGKLEDANNEANLKSGKDRDLSGAPKGSISDAKWSA